MQHLGKLCILKVEIIKVLKELNKIQHYKLQDRPRDSSVLTRYSLLSRYTFYQTYILLWKQLPINSLSLLARITPGNVDSIKLQQHYQKTTLS